MYYMMKEGIGVHVEVQEVSEYLEDGWWYTTRCFEVIRKSGCIYQGVIFTDGVTVIHWLDSSITSFPSFEAFKEIYLDKNPEKNESVRWL